MEEALTYYYYYYYHCYDHLFNVFIVCAVRNMFAKTSLRVTGLSVRAEIIGPAMPKPERHCVSEEGSTAITTTDDKKTNKSNTHAYYRDEGSFGKD